MINKRFFCFLISFMTALSLYGMESKLGIMRLVNPYDHDLTVSITGPEGILIPWFYVNENKVETVEQKGLIKFSTPQPSSSKLPEFTVPAGQTVVVKFDPRLNNHALHISWSYNRNATEKDFGSLTKKWWGRLMIYLESGKSTKDYVETKEVSLYGSTTYTLEYDLDNIILMEFSDSWTTIGNKLTAKERAKYEEWERAHKELYGAEEDREKARYKMLIKVQELWDRIYVLEEKIREMKEKNQHAQIIKDKLEDKLQELYDQEQKLYATE